MHPRMLQNKRIVVIMLIFWRAQRLPTRKEASGVGSWPPNLGAHAVGTVWQPDIDFRGTNRYDDEAVIVHYVSCHVSVVLGIIPTIV